MKQKDIDEISTCLLLLLDNVDYITYPTCLAFRDADLVVPRLTTTTSKVILKRCMKAKDIILKDRKEAGMNKKLVQEALNDLLQFTTESDPNWPEDAWYQEDGYEKGDEKTNFFSECYLYNLIGKDDARTLLGMMRRLKESINKGMK